MNGNFKTQITFVCHFCGVTGACSIVPVKGFKDQKRFPVILTDCVTLNLTSLGTDQSVYITDTRKLWIIIAWN